MEKENNKTKKENKSITLKVFEFFENIGIWFLEKIHLGKLAKLYKEHIEGMRYLICGGLVGYSLGFLGNANKKNYNDNMYWR